ncbi:MAG: hypothetical protein AAFX08_02040 [Pseudomonadota bacterium]
MFTSIQRALELARAIEEFPLGHCSPSDDPDKQTAVLYAFLDLARPFVSAVMRIGDPDLAAQLQKTNLDIEFITEAYILKAELQGTIDFLRELTADPTYTENVKSDFTFLDTNVLQNLRSQNSEHFDLRKLVRFCEELNDVYGRGNYLSAALLMRAIMTMCRLFSAKRHLPQ